MSGNEILKHIRNVRGLKEPVLFLTSRTDEQDITEALNAGADDYCTKPRSLSRVLARMQHYLDARTLITIAKRPRGIS